MADVSNLAGKNFAYYTTDWLWAERHSDLMKSMLLFFDGIMLALPPHLAAETIERDPVLAEPLAEKGLLVNVDPATILDEASAERLAQTLLELMETHQDFWYERRHRFDTLSMGHWGMDPGFVAPSAFETFLIERGLAARHHRRGVVWIDSDMKILVLMLFAQTLQVRLQGVEVALHPVTINEAELDLLLRALVDYQAFPQIALDLYHVTAERQRRHWDFSDNWFMDELDAVGVDLAAVPLDEVLAFRADNGQHFRAYAAGLRDFLKLQVILPHDRDEQAWQVRSQALNERRQAIMEEAEQLRRSMRQAFGIRAAALFFSLVGASWTARNGDPLGALLAASSAAAQFIPPPGKTVTAYSYILRAIELGKR